MDKKHKKKLARKEKLRNERVRATEYRQRTQYPEFVFMPTTAPEPLVEMVREAVGRIDYSDPAQFTTAHQQFYRQVRSDGSDVAFAALRRMFEGDPEAHAIEFLFVVFLGELTFGHMPPDELKAYLPYHNITVVPAGRNIMVQIESLESVKGPMGTIYHSPLRPKVVIDGRPRVVGFSRHAVEQVAARVAHRELRYTNLEDVFAFFSNCVEFQPVTLPSGQLAISFWNEIPRGFVGHDVVETVFAERYDPQASYSYRVGYCPAVIEGDYLKAKTFLYPGYRDTPEYRLLREATVPPERRSEWLALFDSLDGKRYVTDAPPALKWLHEQGVSQVREQKAMFRETRANIQLREWVRQHGHRRYRPQT